MTTRLLPLVSILVLAITAVGTAWAQPLAMSSRTVTVTAKDYKFVLSTRTVPRGRIAFVIRNRGEYSHDFVIANRVSKTIRSGQQTTLTVTLKPGRYPYRCTIDSHAELGMKGVLRVT
jgi:plastocyanin